MKLLLCLFPIYILVLSGIPCQADDDCCMDEIAANAAHSKETKEHPKYPQPCSPFFACGACHGFLIPTYNTNPASSQTIPTVHGATYRQQPLPEFSPAIWQPPRGLML